MAKKLFEEADEDSSGFIDQEELTALVGKLYAKLNIRVNASMQEEFDHAVQVTGHLPTLTLKPLGLQSAMSENSEGVFFPEFVKMLNQRPWRDVLPEDVKAGIPKVSSP